MNYDSSENIETSPNCLKNWHFYQYQKIYLRHNQVCVDANGLEITKVVKNYEKRKKKKYKIGKFVLRC